MKQLIPIFLFISLILFSCGEEEANPVVLEQTEQKVISCDAETTINKEGKSFFSSDGTQFGYGENQDKENAHSGEFSAKVSQESPIALAIELGGLSRGDMVEISLWRLTNCDGASSYGVLESSNGNKFIVDNILSREGKWDLIHKNLLIEEPGKNQTYTFYVYSECKDAAWFDDLEIVIHDNLDGGYNYPNFEGDKIKLELNTDQLRKLELKREEAIEYGLLVSEDLDIVYGTMEHEGDTFQIELRLKGDLMGHLDGAKWSFRIKVKKGSFNGIRTFSLHSPAMRGMMDEWVMHQLYSKEDILSNRYGFIPVELNGVSLGVYAWEEHFEKHLLESQKRREGPIVRLKEDALCEGKRRYALNDSTEISRSIFTLAEIAPYRKGKTLKSPVLSEQYFQAQNLLYQHHRQLNPASELFDVKRLATFYALADLGQSNNGVQWNKQRFYFNPVRSYLEPIAFACYSNSSRKENNRLLGHQEAMNRMEGVLPYTLFPSGDMTLIQEYLLQLKKVSDKEYLDAFLEENKAQIESFVALLQKEFKHYSFNAGELFYQNQESLAGMIQQYQDYLDSTQVKFEKNENFGMTNPTQYHEPLPDMGVKLYLQDTSGLNTYQAINLHTNKLELLGYGNVISMNEELKKPKVLEPFYKSGKTYELRSDSEYYYYRVQGRVAVYKEKMNMWSYPTASSARQEFETKTSYPSSFSKNEDELRLIKGSYTFSNDIFIPSGYTVIIEEGVNIEINVGVSFISYSPIHFQGSSENPIEVSSSASGGFSVLGAEGRSSVSHTTFVGFDTQKIVGWQLTGAVNFFESDVDISHTRFLDNVCEDGLNIIHSDFTLRNSEISGTFSDGFDADYCTGVVSDCVFKNNGNDCMDFSTSQVEIVSCEIIKAGDKGVSGGENSTLRVSDIKIKDVKIGIASKDQSEVHVDGIELDNCTYGFAVFQKKTEYGPASIKVDDAVTKNIETLKLIELNSVIEYEGEIIQGTDSLNIDVLYDL